MNLMTWLFGKRELACEHKWKIVGASYTGGAEHINSEGHIDENTLKVLMCGITHINFICEKCNNLKQEQYTGKFTPPGVVWESEKEDDV